MGTLFSFFAGVLAAGGAVLLPGMLNMSVLDTRLKCGVHQALVFAAGIVLVIAVQASLGVIGAKYLGIDAAMIDKIKVWAIPVFVGLAIFFFYRGYQKHYGDSEEEEAEDEESSVSDGNQLVRGVSLAVMNLLAVPYYYALSTWLFGGEHLPTGLTAKILFVVGVCCGCFGLLTGYAFGAKWIKANARPLTANLNFILSGIIATGVAVHAYRVFTG